MLNSPPEFLSQLNGVKQTSPGQWQAKCPAHKDSHPSLSVSEGDDGRILLHCHSGCSHLDILKALGLAPSALFPAGQSSPRPVRSKKHYDTPEAAADALAVRLDGELVGSWSYSGDTFRVLRFEKADGSKEYRPIHNDGQGWLIGDPPGKLPLYRQPVGTKDGSIFVCEGEKACDAAASIGIFATTSAHGAKSPHKSNWTPLAGHDVVILPDNDDAGRRYADAVAAILSELQPPATVRIVDLPNLPKGGDIVDHLEQRDSVEPETLGEQILNLAAETPVWQPPQQTDDADDAPVKPSFVSAGELIKAYPALRPPVITGLLREGEICNIIAAPKTGKSWLVLDLALAVATGRPWLDKFPATAGDVLVCDNELHSETIAHRLPKVAMARGIASTDYGDRLFVETIRGKSLDLYALKDYFSDIPPGRFKVVVLDALYRFWPSELDENSNSGVTDAYNRLDLIADRLGCCFVLIHHSSKGNQGTKSVVDVGAGAGAQSRATDCHLVLRPHEEDDAIVLDAAVRSWKPVQPLCLQWDFPVWLPAPDLDPTRLKGVRRKTKDKDDKKAEASGPPYDLDRFVGEILTANPLSKEAVLAKSRAADLTHREATEFLALAEAERCVFRVKDKQDARRTVYTTVEPDLIHPSGNE